MMMMMMMVKSSLTFTSKTGDSDNDNANQDNDNANCSDFVSILLHNYPLKSLSPRSTSCNSLIPSATGLF